MADALSKSGSNRSAVRAVCLAVSGVNHPTDQQRILTWLRFALYLYILQFQYSRRFEIGILFEAQHNCKDARINVKIVIANLECII